ncbi:MAG: hypothetical protein U0795_02480 [Pirellulales bacterium]
MFRTTNWALFFCMVGFGGSTCQAAMIESNDPRYPGTANTTIDTIARREWLDWSVTLNERYDGLRAKLLPGGAYEGWRLATDADVVTLLSDLHLPKALTGSESVLGRPDQIKPLASFGPSYKTVYHEILMGNLQEVTVTNYEACYSDQKRVLVWGHADAAGSIYLVGTRRGAWQAGRICGLDNGWALVRDVHSVPEPNGLAMLCVVAPALVRYVRRRSSR